MAPDEAELLSRINARIAELAGELAAYGERLRSKDPTADDRAAFEGWVIGKLAGLEVMVETIAAEIRDDPRT